MDHAYAASHRPGLRLDDQQPLVDMNRMRRYRLERLQAALKRADCDAAVLTNPIYIRYATGVSSAQVFLMHLPARTAIVAAQGGVDVFDEYVPGDLRADNNVVDAWHPVIHFSHGDDAALTTRDAGRWVDAIGAILRQRCGGRRLRLAIDAPGFHGHEALRAAGFDLISVDHVMMDAYRIKSADEVACIGHAVTVAETGMARIREALRPGVTENELLALLHAENIAAGGDWGEYKLLLSGPRTFPWVQESSHRIVRGGELVAMDTGLVGPLGYGADISRTFRCPPGRPDSRQRDLYRIALECLEHNLALFRPGRAFSDIAREAYPLPARFKPHRYGVLAHGIGMADEYPLLFWEEDYAAGRPDGETEAGMVLAVESYVGAPDSIEGVKLEDQIVVTDDGYRLLSTFPYERELFGVA
jgi:Xaa-Pro dipeptidase